MYIFCALVALMPTAQTSDSLTVREMSEVVVSASIKHDGVLSEEPVAVTSFSEGDMEQDRITDTKSLSSYVPNFIQADYGSRMTSSLYMRGIGARMEQPAVGMYVDNIPIMNKNNYDLDYYDVDRVDVLRGPQGTLYGRNTIGCVIDMHTLSPLNYQGTNLHAGYGNGNTSELRASTYQKMGENSGISLALNHLYSDGFFTNEYDGTSADRILSESGRLKAAFRLSPRWTLENTLMAGYVEQKGFAYALYDPQTGDVAPINHNDPNSYERINVIDGLTLRNEGCRFRFSSTTSYQYTDDDMRLDQDFRPESMFTLRQTQREHAVTQEFVLRPVEVKRWQWVTGAFGFYKHNNMSAPVTFKRDGIDQLMLGPANNGIHHMFPNADLLFEEDEFPVESDFKLPVWGASLYHRSSYRLGKWELSAGLRLDYERTAIDYDNSTAVNYRFTLMMPGYKRFPVNMAGEQSKSYFELMPQVSVTYDIAPGVLYASVSRGYKSGGYNTQIFSDILQNKIMTDMMADLGMPGRPAAGYDTDEAISYKPEYSWNYEAGAHLSWLDGRLGVDAALFYISLRDQQLTVFPPGQTTGRMMSNAGRLRSFGAELAVSYTEGRFRFSGSYGYTNMKFERYTYINDDKQEVDAAGNYAPYVPVNTVSAQLAYRQPMERKWADAILISAGWQGMGRIYWNEENSIRQPFYGLLNMSATLEKGDFSVSLWGRNLTGTEYNTFYFKSVGNSFMQRGKPRQFGASLGVRL